MARKSGLGKGLDALFVDNSTDHANGVVTLRISEIEPNKNQPRKDFDENALAQLADSIVKHGVIQPLLVRPMTNGGYQLVAGERRWRASKMAGLSEVPVVVQEMTDTEAMEIGLIENLQREDLNPIEEALGYRELIDSHQMTQDMVAQRVGKSRPVVANALRLLNLPDSVVKMVRSGDLSAGHARALLAIDDPEEQKLMAKKAADGLLTVRDIEKCGKKNHQPAKTEKTGKTTSKDSFYDEMEIALKQELGKKVKITMNGNKGKLEIEFYSKEELSALAESLTRQS